YTPQQVKELERSMLLHDMGKIGTPNSVLHKNGKLNDDEFTHMRNHASGTNEILHDMPFIDKNNSSVLDGASQHHEKYNGTGYPNKLSGNEINEYARIANVADSFDAMSSYRVYHDPISYIDSLNELIKSKVSHFDPVFVDDFISVINEFRMFRVEAAARRIRNQVSKKQRNI
ncbi:MAG: HD domain-containing phosphohydrolase, partial [Candidatus Absconditabacteria bacterium]